jgi:glucan phosphoethanolaminetransferase (alkaline phosphatase superfamily)
MSANDLWKKNGGDLWLVAGLLIPILPNVIYLVVAGHPAFWLGELATSMFIVALPLICGFSGRTNLIILLPFAVLAPGACAFALVTRLPPSLASLQILEEATREELSVFSAQLLLAAAIGAAVAVFYGWLIRRPQSRTLHLGAGIRIVGAALFVVCLGKDLRWGRPAAAGRILVNRLERMSPGGPMVLLARLKFEGSLDRNRSSVFKHYTVRQDPPDAEDEVCVLIIGEAARRSALGLYNPAMATTPRLGAREDLIVFRDAATCGTLTSQAVPIILTGRMPSAGEIAPLRSLGLVEAFRLAGFHTAWISNQEADTDSLSVVNAFAANAGEKIFLNGSPSVIQSPSDIRHYDGELLSPLNRILQTNTGKLFVVVHLIGSHRPYLNRYPPEFEIWPVEPRAKKVMIVWIAPYGANERTQFNHAYLNSILYTDFVLDEIIRAVSTTGRMASVVYLADHGENQPDAPVLPAMHGTNTPDVINIPLLFWMSGEMRTKKRGLVAGLVSNAGKRVSSIDVFPTLCGLYNLRTPEADPVRSLTDPNYREHELTVVTMDNHLVTGDR